MTIFGSALGSSLHFPFPPTTLRPQTDSLPPILIRIQHCLVWAEWGGEVASFTDVIFYLIDLKGSSWLGELLLLVIYLFIYLPIRSVAQY